MLLQKSYYFHNKWITIPHNLRHVLEKKLNCFFRILEINVRQQWRWLLQKNNRDISELLSVKLWCLCEKSRKCTTFWSRWLKYSRSWSLNPKKHNYIFSSFLSGPCNNLDLSADRSTGGGGRRLVFIWSAESDLSNPSLTAVQLAAINDLNANLAAQSSNQKRVSLAANTSLLNIKVRFTVRVRNFLGQNASAHVVVTRVNKDVPTLSVGNTDREHRASLDLKLQGTVIRPYVCGVCFKQGAHWPGTTENLKLTGNLESPRKSGRSLEVMKFWPNSGKFFILMLTFHFRKIILHSTIQ